MIHFGQTSLIRQQGLHPDLVRMLNRAAAIAEPEQDFMILEGVRTREKMMENWGKGRTVAELAAWKIPGSYARPNEKKVTWLRNPFASKHGIQADGFGHAVDALPFPIDWNDYDRFKIMVSIFKQAAHLENVNIVCGADWKTSPDYPHVELG